jgi:prepilin-type N-terminal cleavage/methylation domain-containing protein
MKASPKKNLPARQSGFSLIELIGVLAIMAILASVLVPNTIKSIENAAISAESQTLSNLAGVLPLYLRDQGAIPAAATWSTQLAAYANLSPANLATNTMKVARVYLADPATAPSQRVILLSSMRRGLALPASGAITTAASFQQIWQTADGSVPPATSWAGWSAWAAVANSGQFLLIERVNLLPTYDTTLEPLTFTMNNHTAAATSYNLVLANGTAQAAQNIAAGATVILTETPRVRLNLYSAGGGLQLNYSYVVSTTGRTFDFNGTDWIPQ